MSVPTPPETFTPRVVRPAGLDWVKFDAELARDGSVDPIDKALYAALSSFVDADDRDSDPDPEGEDAPTRTRLAQCIGRSVDTVDRATKRLEERGLLRVQRRRDPNNPKRNLPSVYELCDHERWDERAAARAEARKQAREAARAAREARGGRTDAARGGRTDAARGGRTDAARGGRTDAAVPCPSSECVSLSENECACEAPTPEVAAVTAEVDERERSAAEQDAQTIAEAWTAGTGLPRVPAAEREIVRHALELLQAGHDAAHLALVARWMAPKGWRDLGYALTANGAPRGLSGPPRAASTPIPPSVADVIPLPRLQEPDDERADDERADRLAAIAEAKAKAEAARVKTQTRN
ncbi:hypothetical protein AB0J63_49650 [Streptosporangium canum]|uniref:hypothetical protein n=1 Tax=Streptosporangium canum TaxID=324952 RepID=UPI003442085A